MTLRNQSSINSKWFNLKLYPKDITKVIRSPLKTPLKN